VAGKAPLEEIADSNGFARVSIDADRAGQPGKLIVQATGYKPYVQNIDLNPENLPDVVQLEIISSVPPTDTLTPIQVRLHYALNAGPNTDIMLRKITR